MRNFLFLVAITACTHVFADENSIKTYVGESTIKTTKGKSVECLVKVDLQDGKLMDISIYSNQKYRPSVATRAFVGSITRLAGLITDEDVNTTAMKDAIQSKQDASSTLEIDDFSSDTARIEEAKEIGIGEIKIANKPFKNRNGRGIELHVSSGLKYDVRANVYFDSSNKPIAATLVEKAPDLDWGVSFLTSTKTASCINLSEVIKTP